MVVQRLVFYLTFHVGRDLGDLEFIPRGFSLITQVLGICQESCNI